MWLCGRVGVSVGCVLAAPPAAATETSRRRDGRLQVVPGRTPALAAVWRGKRAMHGCWCDAPSCQPPGTAEATSVASTTSSAMDYPGVAAVHCASGFRTGAGTTPSACQVCALATQTRCCQDWHGTAQRLRVNQSAMVGMRYTHHTPSPVLPLSHRARWLTVPSCTHGWAQRQHRCSGLGLVGTQLV